MIQVSTRFGAIVLDPFAGTASVPAVASLLGRKGLGIEINPRFVREFGKSGYERIRAEARSCVPVNGHGSSSLRQTIVDLRILKFSHALYSAISRGDRLNGTARPAIGAFVLKEVKKTLSKGRELDTESLAAVQLLVLMRAGADVRSVRKAIDDALAVKPLTKYGLRVDATVIPHASWNSRSFLKKLRRGRWYVYRRGQFYKHDFVVRWNELGRSLLREAKDLRQKVPAIFSQVRLSLEIPVPEVAKKRKD
jgi:hypothetical protein